MHHLPSEPNPSDVFVKPRRGTAARVQFEQVENLVGRLLESATNGVMRVGKLRDRVSSDLNFAGSFVEGCLRILCGQRSLVVTGKEEEKAEVRLSDEARARERRLAYATSFAHELVVQSEQIGRLVGHGGTTGSYREQLLRELIQRHIPQRFHAATGFIDGIQNQIDILIYDQLEYAPLFRAGDLVVVPLAAVRALIEVKTNLTSNELKDALQHLAVGPAFGPPIFTGVFAFEGATTPTLVEAIEDAYRMGDELDEFDASLNDVADVIKAICVLQKSILLSTFTETQLDGKAGYTPTVVELESIAKRDSQAAIFFDVMSRYLRTPLGSERLDTGIGHVFRADLTRTLAQAIYGDELWGPYVTGNPDFTDRLEDGVKAYLRWFDGAAWEASLPNS